MDFIRRVTARFALLSAVLLSGGSVAFALLFAASLVLPPPALTVFFLFVVPLVAYAPYVIVESRLRDRDRRHGYPTLSDELGRWIVSRRKRSAKAV